MDNNEKECDFYTIEEFADITKISKQSVRRAIEKGKIQAVNFGTGKYKYWRIPKSEIQRLAVFDLSNLIRKIHAEELNGREV